MRSGLSEAEHGAAKHRAAGAPVYRPAIQSRRSHLRRHPRFWAGLVGIFIGVVLIASFLYDAPPSANWIRLDAHPRSPAAPTSSVSTSTVAIGDDGDVHVEMKLQFSGPVDQLTLQVPDEAWSGGEFEPVVDGVVLDIGDQQVELEDPLVAGERRSVELPSESVDVRLEYDATGTFVASAPSAAGRGLVLLTPLRVRERNTLSQVEVLDARVLNLGCVSTGELSACATRDGATWIATPVADARQVIAQVDMLAGAEVDQLGGP
jgi:hypothetical protein